MRVVLTEKRKALLLGLLVGKDELFGMKVESVGGNWFPGGRVAAASEC